MKLTPVILSGGSGTRLWPISRTQYPKQFAELLETSLFDSTLKRFHGLKNTPWVITNHSLKTLTEKSLSSFHIPLSQAIYEPKANNTAPAIALICKIFEMNGAADAILGIFPSDHLIQNEETFLSALRLAEVCAEKNQVVTLGIEPTYPATGYGYIEVTSQLFEKHSSGLKASVVKGFREKPNEQTAEEFIQAGNFYWNAGMFVFKTSVMIQHFKQFLPKTWAAIDQLKSDRSNLSQVYAEAEPQSIDYGIMEKISNQVCIPASLGWSDIGSWDEFSKIHPSHNRIEIDGSSNYVYSKQNKSYAFIGLDDVMIVDTVDACVVMKRGASQKMKNVVEAIQKSEDSDRALVHPFEIRPWGKFEVLRDTEHFKSKVIHVQPGQQLSYQSHSKRAEHWVVTRGFPEVTLNDEVIQLKPGQNVFIPIGAKHRIKNPHTSEMVEFVEVQVGTYFGEDDIVRYQDDYKRV